MGAAINIAHVLILGPLFVAIGSNQFDLLKGYPLVALGAFIVLYHGFRAYTKYAADGSFPWVNLIHVLGVGPLLITKGLAKDAPVYVDATMIMYGFAAIGYHLWRLLPVPQLY